MYAQVTTVVMDYLSDEQQGQLQSLCDQNPGAFISIAEGDESKPKQLDFDDVFENASDLSALQGDYVYIVADGENQELASMAMETKPGYFAGETTYII